MFNIFKSLVLCNFHRGIRASSFGRHFSQVVNQANIGSGVYISTCSNIYYNLAIEDWIYENVDFTEEDRKILFLWRNKPCVVIGRHQNPWLEVNIQEANDIDIPIARRRSGGGTVYHDLGNLNCTFFTHRKHYKRKENLDLVVSALKREWGLNLEVNSRDDIILDDRYKISGTAAKLGRNTAYHHFTVLLDVDTTRLNRVLHSEQFGISTKATESVRAEVSNLCDINPSVNYNRMCFVIAQEYTKSVLQNNKYVKEVLENEQMSPLKDLEFDWAQQIDLCYVDPINPDNFPDVYPIYKDLTSFEWMYGWTPKFKISHTFHEDMCQLELEIEIEIHKGCIKNLTFISENLTNVNEFSEYYGNLLQDCRYRLKDVKDRLLSSGDNNTFQAFTDKKCKSELDTVVSDYIAECLLSLIPDIR